MRHLCIAAVIFAALPSSAVDAEDLSPEQIVVTATRLPTPQQEIASSITVVTADDIAAHQDQTLPELLQRVPGLNVVQSGGPGGQTSVFLRGTDSNHVKVLVDGIDVGDTSAPNGAFDFGQFLTPDIARVEILRGPQSGLYGSDAIGGVINVITRSGDGPAKVNAGIEGGSFDTFNQTGGIGGSTGAFHYAANIAHFESGATPVTPGELLPPGQLRLDDAYDNVTASTKLGYDVADKLDLGLVARYTDTALAFTGDNFNNYPSTPDTAHSHEETLQYATRGTAHLVLFDGVFEQTAGIAYGSISSTQASPDVSPPDYYAGDRVKLDWQGNLRFSPDEILVLGAEHQRDEIRQPIAAGTTIDSGYAELQSTLGDRLFNSASVRYDSNDRFGSDVTYREAPAFVIADTGTRLKGSVGSGFKAPTLSQMFENYPSFGFYGNPNLKPETSTGYDLGFEQSFADGAIRSGATWFHNAIRNLIDDNATFTSYANVGRAETDGVEAFAAYAPTQTLTLRADYTFTEANDELAHQELLRRPKHKASLDARWQPSGRLSLDADLLAVSSWLDATRDQIAYQSKAPGFVTADMAASYAVTEQVTLYGRVDNLMGQHYQDPLGFLQPGRGFYAGIKTRF
jgi:vitamin B12 transporter